MISRRDLVTGGALGAVVVPAAAGAQEAEIAALRGEVRALQSELLGLASCSGGNCQALERVRAARKQHVKTANRFPEYIDVGYDVWDEIYQWLVKNRLEPAVTRLPDGRYGLLVFQSTTLVLRPDQVDTYIGHPYDR